MTAVAPAPRPPEVTGSASHMLARLIGPVRTRDLMFTGRTLTADEAVDWGIVARQVPTTS